MRRSEFIQKSALGLSSLTLLPTSIWSINLNEVSIYERLKVNEHIRHGSYGSEYISNKVLHSPFSEIRIDHFVNQTDDLRLFDLQSYALRLRVGITGNQVFVQNNGQQLAYVASDSGILWKDEFSALQLEVLNKGDRFEPIDRNMIALSGTCQISGSTVKAPFLLHSRNKLPPVVSKGRTVVLSFPENSDQSV